MKSFIKGIAANYLKSSDRLHAEKISNTCKKISNSMRKTVSTLFSSNSITWRKAHALPIERAEATHGKPNLMRLKVAKCVKILLLPPIERAVKVWEKSTHCLLEKLWEQMVKNHNHSLLNKRWSIRNTIIMGTMTASVLTYLLFRNDNICKIASIEQWSPAVCGKPILFHTERAVSRNLNRSSDFDAIAYWESNDNSTKHILFLRNR